MSTENKNEAFNNPLQYAMNKTFLDANEGLVSSVVDLPLQHEVTVETNPNAIFNEPVQYAMNKAYQQMIDNLNQHIDDKKLNTQKAQP